MSWLSGLPFMPHTHHPLRIAILCSHRAPGLMYLLNQCPDRGVTYEIVACLTSEFTFAEEVRVERRGVPVLSQSIDAFYEKRGASVFRDMLVRAKYDELIARQLEPLFPDVLVLDGYLYLITAPLLEAFGPRIINLHFSDLTLRHPDGRPQFPGLHAVRDAILEGRRETRATVHVVRGGPDAGSPIVRSWPFPVSPLVADLRSQGAADVLQAYVYAHQQRMMRTVSGPLLAAALRLIGTGAVDLSALRARDASAEPWLLDHHELVAPELQLAAC
jgi:folate-dependent phosphoribosylglycinamide formyltransferase PurN